MQAILLQTGIPERSPTLKMGSPERCSSLWGRMSLRAACQDDSQGNSKGTHTLASRGHSKPFHRSCNSGRKAMDISSVEMMKKYITGHDVVSPVFCSGAKMTFVRALRPTHICDLLPKKQASNASAASVFCKKSTRVVIVATGKLYGVTNNAIYLLTSRLLSTQYISTHSSLNAPQTQNLY